MTNKILFEDNHLICYSYPLHRIGFLEHNEEITETFEKVCEYLYHKYKDRLLNIYSYYEKNERTNITRTNNIFIEII